MKVLVLTHEYPPIGGGGGRCALDIAQEMARNGHEIKVLTAHLDPHPLVETDPFGVEIIRIKSMRTEAFRADMRAMLGFVVMSVVHGLKLIRKWKPDIIHVHMAVPAGASAYLLSVLTGTPYVITSQLGDVPGATPQKTAGWFKWIKPFTPPIWKRAKAVTTVSQWVKDLAQQSYPVPIEVIPNGVPYDELDPGKITVNEPPRIIFAGRFMPQKNLLQLVNVLGRLKDLDWTLTLAGDGPLRGEIEAALQENGIMERTTMTGWVKPENVLDWNRRSDILFMPSLSEGFPLVGVQACAMGLAMVMSDAGGNVDLVDPGVNGYISTPNDTEGFVNALRGLLSDREMLLSYRIGSRQHAKQFDIKVIAKRFEKIFEEILK